VRLILLLDCGDEPSYSCSRSPLHRNQCTEKLSIVVAMEAHGRRHPAARWRVKNTFDLASFQHHCHPQSSFEMLSPPPKKLQIINNGTQNSKAQTTSCTVPYSLSNENLPNAWFRSSGLPIGRPSPSVNRSRMTRSANSVPVPL